MVTSGGCCHHHQLRHGGRRVDSRVHQDFHQHQLAAREGSDQLLKHGGASLNILSGFVAGNFSAFWMGLVICS
jgi:hypothetical protein